MRNYTKENEYKRKLRGKEPNFNQMKRQTIGENLHQTNCKSFPVMRLK